MVIVLCIKFASPFLFQCTHRSHLGKEVDEEKALTPHSAGTTLHNILPTFPSNQDTEGQSVSHSSQLSNHTFLGSQLSNGVVTKKPVYGRSISLDLPTTSRKQY